MKTITLVYLVSVIIICVLIVNLIFSYTFLENKTMFNWIKLWTPILIISIISMCLIIKAGGKKYE